MGYRVDYQPVKKVRGVQKRTVNVPAMTGVCLLLFLLLVNSAWPRGAEVLQGLLFSGDVSVTAAALEDMAVELRAGEELSSAVETFCKKVAQGARIDSD